VADFEFIKNPLSDKWVISAPRRAKRTNVEKEAPVCPFCPGQEVAEEELYRFGGSVGDSNWHIRVITNKFPFAPHHEVIIHSPDHHKSFDELPMLQIELIIQTYRQRFNYHTRERASLPAGRQIYIFNNSGSAAGASLTHPHTQLVVIPNEIKLDITPLGQNDKHDDLLETENFLVFCPKTSEWPDEIWIAPKRNGEGFGAITDQATTDMSFVLSRIIQIMDLRHGHEFPFNFYIHPGKNWYLRLIPRTKILGGFELGTNIIVNTQDPKETFAFLKEHFWEPDHEKIKREHQADYRKRV